MSAEHARRGTNRWSMVHGDAFAIAHDLEPLSFDVAILDPPYSDRQHAAVRKRNRGLADGKGRISGCATRRVVDLGFEHFARGEIRAMCHVLADVVRRWSLVFCDDELLPVWRSEAKRSGLEFVRTGVWIRVGGAPQFTGDRPGIGAEFICVMHQTRPRGGRKGGWLPMPKRWNGGGSAAVWEHPEDCPIPGALGPVLKHPIVANRKGQQGSRVHTTQKPEALMLELVSLFSEPGETIFDPTSGSGTTGVAALRLGRRFFGIEQQPRPGHDGDKDYFGTACDRLAAEESQTSLRAYRAGQGSLFGGGRR